MEHPGTLTSLQHKHLRSLSQWLEGLPIADIEKSADMVYKRIALITEGDLSINEFFQSLELLYPTIKYLWDSMHKYYLDPNVVSLKQRPKGIALSQALETRYAAAYAAIVRKQADLAQEEMQESIQIRAIHRAITHLMRALILRYQFYTPAPENLWQSIHKLYYYAEKHGLEDVPLTEASDSEPMDMTIRSVYIHCLLLASAAPYQLRYKDIERLHHALFTWTKYAKLEQDINSDNHTYIVNLNQGKPPVYYTMALDDDVSEYSRGLDTQRLVLHLKMLIDEHADLDPDNQALYGLSKDSLVYLTQSWGHVAKRASQRSKQAGKMQVCIGLAAAHHYLNAEQPFMLEQQVHFGSQRHAESDVQQTIPDTNAPKYFSHEWSIEDVSSTGYCLVANVKDIDRIQSGDLLGLKHTEDTFVHQWQLGVVRWLKHDDNEHLNLGVELILPGYIKVAVQMRQNQASQYFRALLVPDFSGEDAVNYVIMPKKHVVTGQKLLVTYENREIWICLQACYADTASYCQYAYEIVPE